MSVKRKALQEVANGDRSGKKLKVPKIELKKDESKHSADKTKPDIPKVKSKDTKKEKSKTKNKIESLKKGKEQIKKAALKDNDVTEDATESKQHKSKDKEVKSDSSNNTKSKHEMRQEKKKLKAERQSKKKKDLTVFELGVQAKNAWNTVRGDDCPEDQRSKLLLELHTLVKGNLNKIIQAHDTVRVVECLMAKGDETIRQAIYEELKDDLVTIAKSKYGHFFVQKLLNYGTKEQKANVIKSLEGKVAELTRHKIANVVIEVAYNDVADAPQKIRFLQEFFGPEFRMCKEQDLKSAVDVVKKYPRKESGVRRALEENCNILISKGCYNQSIVHSVLYNYMQLLNYIINKKQTTETKLKDEQSNEEEGVKIDFSSKARKGRADLIVQLRDVCVHILHSRDGAILSMNALWHGSAKDRKAIIKSFKTYVHKICGEEYGHKVLLAAFDCVDDTKLMSKAIIGEMIGDEKDGTETEKLTEIFASEKGGRKVLLYLIAGRDTTFFPPDYLDALKQGDGNEFSKKDDVTRRKELVSFIQQSFYKFLGDNLFGILKAGPKSALLVKAALNSSIASAETIRPVLERLADLASDEFKIGEDNLVENLQGHTMLKKTVSHDKIRHGENNPTFSHMLLKSLIAKKTLQRYLECNRGAFVLVAIMETDIPAVNTLMKEQIKPLKKVLNSQTSKGAEILRQKLML